MCVLYKHCIAVLPLKHTNKYSLSPLQHVTYQKKGLLLTVSLK